MPPDFKAETLVHAFSRQFSKPHQSCAILNLTLPADFHSPQPGPSVFSCLSAKAPLQFFRGRKWKPCGRGGSGVWAPELLSLGALCLLTLPSTPDTGQVWGVHVASIIQSRGDSCGTKALCTSLLTPVSFPADTPNEAVGVPAIKKPCTQAPALKRVNLHL